MCAKRTPGVDVRRSLRTWVGTSQLGGKRAYKGHLGKDRNPHHSRRSIASAEWKVTAQCGRRRCLRSAGVSARCRLDEGCPVVGHRDEARSVDRKPRTSQLLTPLTLAMG